MVYIAVGMVFNALIASRTDWLLSEGVDNGWRGGGRAALSIIAHTLQARSLRAAIADHLVREDSRVDFRRQKMLIATKCLRLDEGVEDF